MRTARSWTFAARLTASILAFLAFGGPALGGPPKAAFRPGEIVVKYRSPLSWAGDRSAPDVSAADAKSPELPSVSGARAEALGLSAWRAADSAPTNRPASLRALDRRFELREMKPVFSFARGVTLFPPSTQSTATTKSTPPERGETPVPLSSDLWVLRFDPNADVEDARKAYEADPNVVYAEPNYVGTLCYAPSDPLYAQTASDLALIGIEAAWGVRQGASPTIKVAVIDSGVEAVHPDLASALDLANSYNFADGNANVFDDVGHGTRVAGIVGATANNAEGIAGIAFGCKIMSLDVAAPDGSATTADAASAIAWAASHGARVVNMSLRFGGASQTLKNACDAAWSAGVLLVAAAGNENRGDLPVYPACYDSVVGVGAVMDDGETRAPWSNYNGLRDDIVELLAPGATVFSTIPGSQYNGAYGSGTSFAAPMVSGVAALRMAHNPSQSAAAIRGHLRATASPVAPAFQPANSAGSGLIRADRAFSVPMRPNFAVASVAVDDATAYSASNNADGRWQKGETVALSVTLRNDGADATGVAATLSTTDTQVTLSDTSCAWGNLECGDEKTPTDRFTAVALNASSPAHKAPFTLSLAANDGSFTQTLPFTADAESLYVPPTIIGSNTAWTADKTYLINANTVVMNSAKLTIEPGTTVRFGKGGALDVRGAIDAQGTADRKIEFTSVDGRPSGSYALHVLTAGDGVTGIFVGDADNDGDNDIVSSNQGTHDVSLIRWNGSGFDPEIRFPAGLYPSAVFVGDADNDGDNDIVAANVSSADVSLIRWNGSGFDPEMRLPVSGYPYTVFVGDADNDGDNDIVTGEGGTISLIRWNGSGFDSRITFFTMTTGIRSICIADADNDGDNEIVAADYWGKTSIFRWNGSGFNPPTQLATGDAPYSVVVADADNDGDNDIVTANYGSDDVSLVRWNGLGFDPETRLPVQWGSHPKTVFVGDADNDGDNDIVAGLSILRWNGSGFDPEASLLLPFEYGAESVFVADVNNDGSNDIAIAPGYWHDVLAMLWDRDLGGFPAYGGLSLRPGAGSSVMSHCNLRFAPVRVETDALSMTDCLLDRTGGDYGLDLLDPYLAVNVGPAIERCTVRGNNLGSGIRAAWWPLADCAVEDCGENGIESWGTVVGCIAQNCGRIGIQAEAVIDCIARGNYREGMTVFESATRCVAEGNGGDGILVRGNGLSVWGNATACLASGNGERGVVCVYGSVENTTSTLNASGIRSANATGCVTMGNDDVGIQASERVVNSRAIDNGGLGIAGGSACTVSDCTVVGNGGGLSGAGTVLRCAVAQNRGEGVVGGAIDSCSVHHNTGAGASAPESVTNSWIVGNEGVGISGKTAVPYSTIDHSSILWNLCSGVKNSGTMTACNLYGNGGASGFDYEDTRLSSVLPQVNLSGNYWGPETTPIMSDHPWGTYHNIPRIYDVIDNTNLCEAKYAGHLTSAASAPPNDAPPAFLLTVEPNEAEAVGVGATLFTLTFTKNMNTAPSVPMAVTFGLAAPYTTHVVEPAAGWTDARTWRGVFAVQSDTGDGVNTIRVANARDAGGYVVPDDTAHKFTIDTSSPLSANNGLAIGTGTGAMQLTWTEEGKPPTALGYNVRRSESGTPGTYRRINPSLVTAPSMIDSAVSPKTAYFYIVDIVDSQHNSTQWTPPFYGVTGNLTRAKTWDLYE